jgi:hypothetical protein
MALITTSLPRMSLTANQNGKWKRSWGSGHSEESEKDNIESDGRATVRHMILGNPHQTYMPLILWTTSTNNRMIKRERTNEEVLQNLQRVSPQSP